MNLNYSWTSDLLIGAAIGAVGQLANNFDAKKMAEQTDQSKKYAEWKKLGTIAAFGIPVLGIVASMTNIIPIPSKWTDKMVSAGSVLAGAKAVELMTKKHYRLTYVAAGQPATPRYGAAAWMAAGRSPAPAGPTAYNVLGADQVMV